MRLLAILISCTFLITTSACAGGKSNVNKEPGAMKVELIEASSQCGVVTKLPGALWIAEPSIYKDIYARQHGLTPGPDLPDPPQLDFAYDGVLIIYLGEKPTAGYGLSLVNNDMTIEGEFASITVAVETPPPDAVTAQVLTNPCLMLKLPRGEYSTIRVIDPMGIVLMETVVQKDICE